MRRALGSAASRGAAPYLRLMDRRLGALRAIAAGRAPAGAASLVPTARERALARRFLAAREASWHDGDENLVRGFVDRWPGRSEDPSRATARGLVEAADALAAMGARPESLWFFAWVVESTLQGPSSIARPPAMRREGRVKGARIPIRRARPGGPRG